MLLLPLSSHCRSPLAWRRTYPAWFLLILVLSALYTQKLKNTHRVKIKRGTVCLLFTPHESVETRAQGRCRFVNSRSVPPPNPTEEREGVAERRDVNHTSNSTEYEALKKQAELETFFLCKKPDKSKKNKTKQKMHQHTNKQANKQNKGEYRWGLLSWRNTLNHETPPYLHAHFLKCSQRSLCPAEHRPNTNLSRLSSSSPPPFLSLSLCENNEKRVNYAKKTRKIT